MNQFRHFRQWVGAVLTHWYGWAGGTLISIVLLVGQEVWGWQPSKLQFVVILGLGLSWSTFAAWRDEHTIRLKAEASQGNRPFIGPRNYKRREDQRVGLTVSNSEYAAYDVHIPDAPIGDSGYLLQFEGMFAQVLHNEEAFFETWLETRAGLPGEDGSQLFEVMRKANIESVNFGILSKDTNPTPNWYRDNCVIRRDNQRHRSGLVLRHVNQEVIPAPIMD